VLLNYSVFDSNTVTVSGDTYFTAEGLHDGLLIATDRAGNTSVLAISFVIDKTVPNLIINPVTSPTNRDVVLTYTVSEPCQVFGDTIFKNEGTFSAILTAVDYANNINTASITFTIDKTPPVLIINPITSPTNKTVILTYSTNELCAVSGETEFINDGYYNAVLIAADAAGNTSSASISFIIDKTPPVIKIDTVSTPTNQNVILSCTSNESCVVSGDTFFTNEGEYNAVLIAIDLAGNTSAASINFVIDKTNPVLVINPETSPTNKTVKLDYFTNEPCSINGDTIFYNDGNYNITLAATDLAGNSSTASVTFLIDKTKPELELKVFSNKLNNFISSGQELDYSDSVIVSYTLNDTLSGISSYSCLLNYTDYLTNNQLIEDMQLNLGNNFITFSAEDKAGNADTKTFLIKVIDNAPPVTTYYIEDPKYILGQQTFINPITRIILNAFDEKSGVMRTEYKIDEGSYLQGTIITGLNQGSHTISFRSIDNSGNIV